jgi:hypothetical protein
MGKPVASCTSGDALRIRAEFGLSHGQACSILYKTQQLLLLVMTRGYTFTN